MLLLVAISAAANDHIGSELARSYWYVRPLSSQLMTWSTTAPGNTGRPQKPGSHVHSPHMLQPNWNKRLAAITVREVSFLSAYSIPCRSSSSIDGGAPTILTATEMVHHFTSTVHAHYAFRTNSTNFSRLIFFPQ